MAIQAIVADQPPRPLNELEAELYTLLLPKMEEIRASLTRFTMASMGVMFGTGYLVRQYEIENQANQKKCEKNALHVTLACANAHFNPLLSCPNPSTYCELLPRTPKTLGETFANWTLLATIYSTGYCVFRGWKTNLLNLKNALTARRGEPNLLNQSVYNTVRAISQTAEYTLLQQSPGTTKQQWPEQLRRRRLLFFSSLVPKILSIPQQSPQFQTRISAVLTELVRDHSGLEQLRDIRKCIDKIARDRMIFRTLRELFPENLWSLVCTYDFNPSAWVGTHNFEFRSFFFS